MIIKGDLLDSNVDIILHQVNLDGVMGSGIAYQIENRHPNVLKEYQAFEKKELGEVCFVKTDTYVVGNCFSQKSNFDTDYEALEMCLSKVLEYMQKHNLGTVGIPYKYGCGIANGNWDIVIKIFEGRMPDIKVYKL